MRSMLNGYLLGKTFSKTNNTRLLYTLHRCENSHHKFTEYNECFFQVDFSSFKATKRGDVSKSSTSSMAELEFWTLECYKRAISQVKNLIWFLCSPSPCRTSGASKNGDYRSFFFSILGICYFGVTWCWFLEIWRYFWGVFWQILFDECFLTNFVTNFFRRILWQILILLEVSF